jgi:hypothetical protein
MNRRKSWFQNVFGLDSTSSFRAPVDARPIPLPDGCHIPNAIFARKFGIVPESQPLPPIPFKFMPTAESKAIDAIAEAAAQGFGHSAAAFRGPFTPQLGFDGGLDYRWNDAPRECSDTSPADVLLLVGASGLINIAGASYRRPNRKFPQRGATSSERHCRD